MVGEGWRAARVSDFGRFDGLRTDSAGCPFVRDSGVAEVVGKLADGPNLVAAIGRRGWLLKEGDRAEAGVPYHADYSWLAREVEVEVEEDS